MKIRLSTLILLGALIFGGVAVSQTFLGNVIQLGQTPTVSLPAASATNKGGLIFDTTTNAPKYSDGTAWQSFGSSSFFYDAGWGLDGGTTGFMQTDNPVTKNDGGTVLTLLQIPAATDPLSPGTFSTTSTGLRTNSIELNSVGRTTAGGGITFMDFFTGAFDATGTQTYRGALIGAPTGWEGSGISEGLTLAASTTGGVTMRGSTSSAYWDVSRGSLYLGMGVIESGLMTNNVRLGVKGSGDSVGLDIAEFFSRTQNVTSATPALALDENATLVSNRASGNNAFSILNNGARIDTGTGSNDYFISDGTGIQTPGYVQSTMGFSSGAGIIASRVRASGAVLETFDSTAASAGGAGDIGLDTTNGFGQMRVQTSSSAFGPLAQPHAVLQRQTLSTRMIEGMASAGSGNVGPEIAERLKTGTNAADTIQMYYDYGASGTGITTYLNSGSIIGRTWHLATTSASDGAKVRGFPATSAATSTFFGLVSSDSQFTWCQSVAVGATITSMAFWAGMLSADHNSTATTLTATGVAFRYDTAVDGLLYLCTRDSTTQSCTSTGITVAASTSYDLCITLDSARTIWASVNGVHKVKTSTNVPTTATALSPFHMVFSHTAATRQALFSDFQVEWR